MRSCYSSQWAPFTDSPATTVHGRYYFSPPGTPFYPGVHWLGSRTWRPNETVTGNEPPGSFPPIVGELGNAPHRWDSGALPVALPLNQAVGSADCIANGEPIANAVSAVDLEGGFLQKCFISQRQPNADFIFGWSVWQCPTQLFWCDALTLLAQGHVTDAQTMLAAQFRNATVTVIGQSQLYPPYFTVSHPSYACVGATGTSKLAQVLVQALNLVQGPQDYGNFGTGQLWYDFASYLQGIMSTAGVLDGRPLMLCGHSYGAAAILALIARIKLAQPQTEIRYLTFGCPKPGDVRLSVQLDKQFDGLSLVNDGDFITALPPSADVIAALSQYLPTAGLTNWTRWKYTPETTLMTGANLSKNTYQRYDSLGLANFLAAVALSNTIGTVTPHDLTEYGARIRLRCSRLLPTDIGEVYGMETPAAGLAELGEVLGMIVGPAPITTICCPSGNPTVRTVTIVSADPPNGFLSGLTWQVTWNPPDSAWDSPGGGTPTTPGTRLTCTGLGGWNLRFQTFYLFNRTEPIGCGTITFTGPISTNSGTSLATITVQDGIPPPPTVFSLVCDGATGYVDCGPTTPSQFSVTSPWSLSIWVKPGSTGSPQIPLSLANPSNAAGWYSRYAFSGESGLSLWIYDGTNFLSWRTPNGAVPTGTWSHVCFTYDGTGSTGGRLVYVNGTAVTATYLDSGPPSGIAYGLAHCNHGRRDDMQEYYGGSVCQPALYSGVLTPTEVADLATGTDPTLVGTPTNVWKYGEGSGTTVADAIGVATGTLTGGVTWSTDIPAPL